MSTARETVHIQRKCFEVEITHIRTTLIRLKVLARTICLYAVLLSTSRATFFFFCCPFFVFEVLLEAINVRFGINSALLQ